MATRVGLGVNFNDAVKLADPQNPGLVQESATYLIWYTRRVIAYFLLKCSNFRFRGNKGQSSMNFDDNVNLADPKNSRLAKESRLCLLHKRSYSKLWVQKR